MLACSIFYITQRFGAQRALNKILPEFFFHKKYEAYWIDMEENEIPPRKFSCIFTSEISATSFV